MLNAYHQCNQRQLGIKTATDQRHKVGDKQTSMLGIIPTILPQWCGNLKTCAKNGKKIIIKTAFSIQPIRTHGQKTIFSHVQVAVAKI